MNSKQQGAIVHAVRRLDRIPTIKMRRVDLDVILAIDATVGSRSEHVRELAAAATDLSAEA